MLIYPIVLEAVDINGIVWIAAYAHYFAIGSLRIHSMIHSIKLEDIRNRIEESDYESWLLNTSRRWLQKSEMPYPGYCRAPGSGKCLPVLCNCKKLLAIWKKLKKNNRILLTYLRLNDSSVDSEINA